MSKKAHHLLTRYKVNWYGTDVDRAQYKWSKGAHHDVPGIPLGPVRAWFGFSKYNDLKITNNTSIRNVWTSHTMCRRYLLFLLSNPKSRLTRFTGPCSNQPRVPPYRLVCSHVFSHRCRLPPPRSLYSWKPLHTHTHAQCSGGGGRQGCVGGCSARVFFNKFCFVFHFPFFVFECRINCPLTDSDGGGGGSWPPTATPLSRTRAHTPFGAPPYAVHYPRGRVYLHTLQ